MKFSIIIPVYNVEKYLEQCLNSVLNQTFTDYEVICVNDGSTDNSLEILQKFQISKFQISKFQNSKIQNFKIINKENGGLSDARNAGILAAKGDYIFLLDSDDWIVPNALEILAENIENQDFIWFSGKVFFEETKTEIIDKPFSEPQIKGWDYYNKYALVPRRFHFVTAVLRLYKRNFLIENELFFKKGIYHEDNLFTPICCYYAKNVKVIPDCLYVYRIREGSITQKTTEKRLKDIIFVANTLSDFFIQKGNIDKTVIYRDLAFYYPNILILAKKENKDWIADIYEQINWQNYKEISKGFWCRLMFFMVKNKISLFYHYQTAKKIINKVKKIFNNGK